MQSFLLDTCAVLWLANGEMGRFSSAAVKALREADALHISPMTEWEIALKWRDGGIDLPMPPRELMARFREHFGVSVAPLTEEVMFRAAELPRIHKDPADRFIIATALISNMTVVTADRRFPEYGVAVVS